MPADLRLAAVPYSSEEVWASLFAIFRNRGYIRRPRSDRPADPAAWELCFLCGSQKEARALRPLLFWCGFPAPEPIRRRGKNVLAIPGRGAVECMHELWDLFAPETRPRG